MHDYERVATVIRYLDRHQAEQPDLATLAAEVKLSPAHFHRLFTQWVGVTPKDFLQCLNAEQVKAALRRGESALGAALDAGLSGPGRLHDLCVTLEGASPGEIKSGGAGWEIAAGFAASPFGQCLIARGERGICHLSFANPGEEKSAWSRLSEEWPAAKWVRNDKLAQKLSREIFARPGAPTARPPLRVFVRASPFRVRVWRALLRVPPGGLVTYRDLAAAIGQPGAARAVGTAMAENPVACLIPCHRVIRATGGFGNYHWGAERKAALIGWESARPPSKIA